MNGERADSGVDKGPDAFRTISEVADELHLPQHVLRFWETRFPQIKPLKRGGGRRYYRRDDVDLLRGIRHLLYGEGYTIRGVQRILKDEGLKYVQTVWRDADAAPSPRPRPERVAELSPAAPAGDDGRPGLFGLLPKLSREPDLPLPPRVVEVPLPRAGAAPGVAEVLPAQELLAEPPGRERPDPAARPVPASQRSARRPARGSLRDALAELTECRRILDDVLGRRR